MNAGPAGIFLWAIARRRPPGQCAGGAGRFLGVESAHAPATGLTGEYLLNGTKYYCTGAVTAHWIPVAALDDQERQVVAYVPRDAAGRGGPEGLAGYGATRDLLAARLTSRMYAYPPGMS